MNLKKIQVVFCAAGLISATAAHAQSYLNGTLGVVPFAPTTTASYTASSLTFSDGNTVASVGGDFTGNINSLSGVSVYSGTLSGIPSSSSVVPLSTPIDNFLDFSTTSYAPGTTPANRFDFELTGISDVNPADGNFSGTGIFYDSTGAFAPTAGTVNIDMFTEPTYSITLAALGTPGVSTVPEPSTIGLVASGLLGAWGFRRRKA